MTKMFNEFLHEEEGMGTIEIAILIAALVALAITFRKQLKEFLGSATRGITSNKDAMENPMSDFTVEPSTT